MWFRKSDYIILKCQNHYIVFVKSKSLIPFVIHPCDYGHETYIPLKETDNKQIQNIEYNAK